jgi:hypothetical protein
MTPRRTPLIVDLGLNKFGMKVGEANRTDPVKGRPPKNALEMNDLRE